MNIEDDFDEIIMYAHFRNWAPDWVVVRDIYKKFPNSFSVLSPFAYSYMEELIRSTTSEYGLIFLNGKHEVGMSLIKLAITENKVKNPEYVSLLEEIKTYYYESKITDEGGNRHGVAHGYIHPRFWNKEDFEKLLFSIARLSKHSGF